MASFSRFCASFFLVSSLVISFNSYAWNPVVTGAGAATFTEGAITGGAAGITQAGTIGVSWKASQAVGATAGQWAQANAYTSTIGVSRGWSLGRVAMGAKNFLKAGGWTIGAGLLFDYLADKYNWFNDDGQLLEFYAQPLPPIEGFWQTADANGQSIKVSNINAFCNKKPFPYGSQYRSMRNNFRGSYDSNRLWGSCDGYNGFSWIPVVYYYSSMQCPAGSKLGGETGCYRDTTRPVPASSIDDADLSGYVPNDADAKVLASYMPSHDSLVITSQPSPVKLAPEIDTAADGTVTEKSTQVTPHAVVTADGQIALDYTTETTTKTYKDGQLTDTKTTTKTITNSQATPQTQPQTQPQAQQKTDCAFMPTVCRFIEWVKRDDVPVDTDLSALKVKELPIENKTYTIDFGVAQCPSPRQISFTFFGPRTYELSYDLFCRIASGLRYIVLAVAYLFAAKIIAGVARD